MWKIFEGANGLYVAWQDDEGFHHQPSDNGSRIGWDDAEARRQLRRAIKNRRK